MTRTREQIWRSMAMKVIHREEPIGIDDIYADLHSRDSNKLVIAPPDQADLSKVLRQAVAYGMAEETADGYTSAPIG